MPPLGQARLGRLLEPTMLSVFPVSIISVSRLVVPDSLRPHGLQPHQAPVSMRFSRQGYWSGLAISFSRGSSQPMD